MAQLQGELSPRGYRLLLALSPDAVEQALSKKPNLAVINVESFPPESDTWHILVHAVKQRIPILAVVPESRLPEWESSQNIDDLVVDPLRKGELASRVRRLLKREAPATEDEIVQRGPLMIDVTSYEVRVDGLKVDLTYREYQLLKYLADHPGKVVTRETLLNRVWGYDYLGGDRTIDVHIRRLRSKLEDTGHVFIDTVRNVGYRFRQPAE